MNQDRISNARILMTLGCVPRVAHHILGGITYCESLSNRYTYVAGRMRGMPDHGFGALDDAKFRFLALGYNVISPADIDRAALGSGAKTSEGESVQNAFDYCYRDCMALFLLSRQQNEENAVAFLPGFESSTGAFAELGIARWLGLKLLDGYGLPLGENIDSISYPDIGASLHKTLRGNAMPIGTR